MARRPGFGRAHHPPVERRRRLDLVSQPTDALGDLGGQSATEESVVVPEGGTDAVPQPQTGSYRLRVALSRADADPARQVRVKLKDR